MTRGATEAAVRLSEVLSGRQPERHAGPVFPGHHCGLFEATFMAALFPASATLVVGPASCLYQAQVLAARRTGALQAAGAALRWLPLRQEDLALGCDALLEEAIREVVAECRPRLLFVVTTCTPEITGVDVGAILSSLRGTVDARLAAVRTNGFADLGRRQGTKAFLAALADIMDPVPRRPGAVNLLATRPPGPGAVELARALEEAGLTVHAFIPGSPPETLAGAPAAVNVILDAAAEPLARAMERRFGTPRCDLGHRYRPEDVGAALVRLGDFLGADLAPAADRLRARTAAFLAHARRRLEGVPFGIGAVEGSRYEAAAFLAELGMIPLFIEGAPLPEERPWAELLLALGHDPAVALPGGTAGTARLLAAFRPRIYIGHAPAELLAALGVAHCHLNSWWSEPAFAVPRRAAANVLNALAGGAPDPEPAVAAGRGGRPAWAS